MHSRRSMLALLCSILVFTFSADGQTFTLHRPAGAGATVELSLPSLKTGPGEEVSIMTFMTSIRFRTGEQTTVQLLLPYMQYNYKLDYTSPYYNYSSEEKSSGLMNVSVGVTTKPGDNSAWEFLLTIPTVSEKNSMLGFVGVLTDFDRFENYLHKVISLGAYGNLLTSETSTFVGRLRIGPTLWKSTSNTTSNNSVEALLDVALGLGFRVAAFEVGAYATTRTILTEDKLLNEKTVIQTTLSAQVTIAPAAIQVWYRIPQEKSLKNALDGVLGLAAVVSL